MDERDGSARRVQQVDSPRASSLVPSSYFSPSMMMMMMMLFRGGAPKARLCVQFHDFIPRHYLWRGAMIKLTTAPFSFCVCVRERERAHRCRPARFRAAVWLCDITMARVEALSWLQQQRSPTGELSHHHEFRLIEKAQIIMFTDSPPTIHDMTMYYF